MNDPDDLDDGHRVSDGEGLEWAGLADGDRSRAAGHVVGSGRTRAEAGMTDARRGARRAGTLADVRLAGLEPLASPQLVGEAARYAIEAVGQRRAGPAPHRRRLQTRVDRGLRRGLCRAAHAGALGRRAEAQPTRPKVGYQELVASARLRDIGRGNVAGLRELVFGSPGVPFATLAEATTWIEAEQKRAGTYSPEESRELRVAYGKIAIELLQLRLRSPGFRYDHSHPARRCFVTRQGAGLRSWEVGKSEPLLMVQQGLEALVRDLVVEEWQAADFVLLDVPPAVPRYSISRRRSSGPRRRRMASGDRPASWIELRIHDRFFSYEDIRAVFRDLAASGFLLSRKSPAQLAKLERLQRFVDERRPPQGWRGGALHKALPWRQVMSEWNEANPEAHYCLSGIQKAYKEANDYLSGAPTSASRHRGAARPSRDVGGVNFSAEWRRRAADIAADNDRRVQRPRPTPRFVNRFALFAAPAALEKTCTWQCFGKRSVGARWIRLARGPDLPAGWPPAPRKDRRTASASAGGR